MRHRKLFPALLAILLAGLGLSLGAPPAEAQWWQDRNDEEEEEEELIPRWVDVSVGGGAFFSTDWSDFVSLGTIGGATGTFQQVLLRELRVDPGPMADVAVTYWEDRLGVRFHGAFSRSCLAVALRCEAPGPVPGEESPFAPPPAEVRINTWLLNVGGMFRLVEPRPRQIVRPYLTVGFGGVVYDPDVGLDALLPRFIDEDRDLDLDDGDVIIIVDETTFLLSQEELGLSPGFSLHFGLGADVRIPVGRGGTGLRFEVTDHIRSSPLRITLDRLSGGIATRDDPVERVTHEFGTVHNLRFSASLFIEFGKSPKEP